MQFIPPVASETLLLGRWPKYVLSAYLIIRLFTLVLTLPVYDT